MLDELVDEDPSDAARFGTVPVIRLEGASGEDSAEIEMPHWTAPATGQVPKVLIEGRAEDEDDTWAVYGAAPRWRDSAAGWEEEDYDDVSDLGDDLPRVGALDDSDRPAIDEFFDLSDQPPTTTQRSTCPSRSPRAGTCAAALAAAPANRPTARGGRRPRQSRVGFPQGRGAGREPSAPRRAGDLARGARAPQSVPPPRRRVGGHREPRSATSGWLPWPASVSVSWRCCCSGWVQVS